MLPCFIVSLFLFSVESIQNMNVWCMQKILLSAGMVTVAVGMPSHFHLLISFSYMFPEYQTTCVLFIPGWFIFGDRKNVIMLMVTTECDN